MLLVTLIFDDVLDDVIPDLDWLSGPVVGAALATFGVVGAMTTEAADTSSLLGVVVGAACGIVLGYGTLRMTKALTTMPTDATPTSRDLVGKEGRVVTAIPDAGLGEILVHRSGQPVKVSARSHDGALTRGAAVVIVDVESSTRVVVQEAERFWNQDPPRVV